MKYFGAVLYCKYMSCDFIDVTGEVSRAAGPRKKYHWTFFEPSN